MSERTVASALIVAGLVLVVVGFSADAIGIGRFPGMGVLQWGAAVGGLVLTVAGFVVRARASTGGESPDR